MKIFVTVKTNSKEEKLERQDANHFLVWTREPAKEDKANNKTIKILSKFFDIAPSRISLLTGRHFKQKTFEIK